MMRLGDDPFDWVNERAVAYAREQAEGSNTVWRPIWRVVAEGTALGWRYTRMIDEAVALGLPRAAARTAVEHALAEANSMGALRGLREARAAGVAARKAWLTASDPCEACRLNAAQGAINLEARFASGHMTPPACLGCRCTLIPAVDE